ncbi:MAG: hypothetical protein PVH40_05040, partial [Gemmatimonadales bacterium]
MKRAGIEHLTAGQLRDIVLQFADDFIQAVEHTADSVRATSDDPRVQRRALQWKLASARSVREAALVSDPLLGLVDVWLFTIQARMFIESPPDALAVLPPEYGDAALRVLSDQEARARRLAIDIAGEERVLQFEPRLLEYAAEHPINPLTLARTSVLAADSALLAPVGGGIGGTIAATHWSVREVNDRLASVNDALSEELRWNIELLAHDLATLPAVDSTLGGVKNSLDRLAALADTLPTLVGGERAVVLEALHTELATLTTAIDDMRLETLDAVSAERLAVLDAIARERVAVLEAISQERLATLAAVDSILIGAIDHSDRLVDHVFW